jgi:ABC-type lipoprotein export system ATPase subunit
MTKKELILQVSGVSKSFKQGRDVVKILDGANLSLYKNEVVALVGPSGCGKTTFLQIIGLLDEPTKGSIIINKNNLSNASDGQKTEFRKRNIGFVYQSHNLLSDFTAFDNIMMPLILTSKDQKFTRDSSVFKMLSKLGLENRRNHFPSQLSGGEQQRVAIGRSIIHNPMLVLADEPTGNLDSKSARNVIDLLINAIKKQNKSLIIVTHNSAIAKKADRVITIDKGKIVEKEDL